MTLGSNINLYGIENNSSTENIGKWVYKFNNEIVDPIIEWNNSNISNEKITPTRIYNLSQHNPPSSQYIGNGAH